VKIVPDEILTWKTSKLSKAEWERQTSHVTQAQRILENPPKYTPDPKNKRGGRGIEKVVVYLGEGVKKREIIKKNGSVNEAVKEQLIQEEMSDIVYLRTSGWKTGTKFYTTEMDHMMVKADTHVVGGLKTLEKKVVFKAILSITSQGNRPSTNYANAVLITSELYEKGKIPFYQTITHPDGSEEKVPWPAGMTSSPALRKNLQMLSYVRETVCGGDDVKLSTWLSSLHTVKELSQIRFNSGVLSTTYKESFHVKDSKVFRTSDSKKKDADGKPLWKKGDPTYRKGDKIHSAGEIKPIASLKPSGKLKQTDEVRGIRMFGPKIGPFGRSVGQESDIAHEDRIAIDIHMDRDFARRIGDGDNKARYNVGKDAKKVPDKYLPKERAVMAEIVAEAADRLGIPHEEAQSNLWHLSQHVYYSSGAKAANPQSFAEVADAFGSIEKALSLREKSRASKAGQKITAERRTKQSNVTNVHRSNVVRARGNRLGERSGNESSRIRRLQVGERSGNESSRIRRLQERHNLEINGGAGSGFYGHSGRPGEIGGSGPGGDSLIDRATHTATPRGERVATPRSRSSPTKSHKNTVAFRKLITLSEKGLAALERSNKSYDTRRETLGLPKDRTDQEASNHAAFLASTWDTALGHLPLPALNILAKNIQSVNFYKSPEDLTISVHGPITGQKNVQDNELTLGAWSRQGYENNHGSINLDGSVEGDADPKRGFGPNEMSNHIYLHEISHALDWDQSQKDRISNSSTWFGAANEEIKKMPEGTQLSGDVFSQMQQIMATPKLSYRALHSPAEAFAEFGRLAYTDPIKAERDFPRCWKIWKDHKLLR
jgi:hypothetical protein